MKLVGWNSHSLLRSSAGTSTPRGMKQLPELTAMSLSGRWMPSKIVPMMPGPSSTERGCCAEEGRGAYRYVLERQSEWRAGGRGRGVCRQAAAAHASLGHYCPGRSALLLLGLLTLCRQLPIACSASPCHTAAVSTQTGPCPCPCLPCSLLPGRSRAHLAAADHMVAYSEARGVLVHLHLQECMQGQELHAG